MNAQEYGCAPGRTQSHEINIAPLESQLYSNYIYIYNKIWMNFFKKNHATWKKRYDQCWPYGALESVHLFFFMPGASQEERLRSSALGLPTHTSPTTVRVLGAQRGNSHPSHLYSSFWELLVSVSWASIPEVRASHPGYWMWGGCREYFELSQRWDCVTNIKSLLENFQKQCQSFAGSSKL